VVLTTHQEVPVDAARRKRVDLGSRDCRAVARPRMLRAERPPHVIRPRPAARARGRKPTSSTRFLLRVVVTIVPLGIGPEPNCCGRIAPGVVWLPRCWQRSSRLPRLFANEFRDAR